MRNKNRSSSQLSRQLTDLTENCRDYDEMQKEILFLRDSYRRYDDEEQADLDELCAPVLALLNRLKKESAQKEQEDQIQLIKTAINTLSYTELEVVVKIFEVLEGTEGILVTGKIADGMGITRSVVVNALRKLESARIIESRSLGVKGTYIKVLNPLWGRELGKLRG